MNRIASILAALWLPLAGWPALPSAAWAQETFSPKPGQLYQLHKTGEIYGFLSEKCLTNQCKCLPDQCPAWRRLDFNPATAQLAATGSNLYQIHQGGPIFVFKSQTCSETACLAWDMLDDDPNAVFAKLIATSGLPGYTLYRLHWNGAVWRVRGPKPCDGTNCPDWQLAANISGTSQIAATTTSVGDVLYLREAKGNVYRLHGWTCSVKPCNKPELIDNRGLTQSIAAAQGEGYQVRRDGTVWRTTGQDCVGKNCSKAWEQMDNKFAVQIVATDKGLYQRRDNGEILFNKGTPCAKPTQCNGWALLDNNRATVEIAASPWGLYQRHANGSLWRYLGQPCTLAGCGGWEMIDNNSRTIAIVSAN